MTHAVSILMLGLAVATAGFAGSFNGQATAADQHGEKMMKCAKVCSECQLECDACFRHCLALLTESKHEHEKTARLCADCAECCKACATLCARESLLAGPMLECCAKCCKQCADACDKFEGDKHMAACAKACRTCEKECADMLRQMGK